MKNNSLTFGPWILAGTFANVLISRITESGAIAPIPDGEVNRASARILLKALEYFLEEGGE